MRTRQFKQLAGMSPSARIECTAIGLRHIAENVVRHTLQADECASSGAFQVARLAQQIAREEAGKFLVLIDAFRGPGTSQATMSRQFERAGQHLAKLIYAQVADYSIASQGELLGAVERHRRQLHLDGPNGFDWIFSNELISEREGALYVDLVEHEGGLDWLAPDPGTWGSLVPRCRSVDLVIAIESMGFATEQGLRVLPDAWDGFDPLVDSHCTDWAKRTEAAAESAGFAGHAQAPFVIDRWPMPMVEIDVAEVKVAVADLQAKREALGQAWLAQQFGLDHREL
jgi:AbiV family abortive infection protein